MFPSRTKLTPIDSMAFVGDPPLIRPDADEVHVSCTFTWDKAEAERLQTAWMQFYPVVLLGGPAYGDCGGRFESGKYLAPDATITSRGCNHKCWFCLAWQREGRYREYDDFPPGRIVLDNNPTLGTHRHLDKLFRMAEDQIHFEFAGGLEAARIDDYWVTKLRSMKNLRQFFLAYDQPGQDRPVKRAIEKLLAVGFNRRKIRCFVLAGYPGDTTEAATRRCEEVWDWGGLPFGMVYVAPDGKRRTGNSDWGRWSRLWTRPAAMFAQHRPVTIDNLLIR